MARLSSSSDFVPILGEEGVEMKVWGLDPETIQGVVETVSEERYGGNMVVKRLNRISKRVTTLTIRVRDSRGPGAKMSDSGRHTCSCTWTAHGDVIRALLEYGAKRVKSVSGDYIPGSFPARVCVLPWESEDTGGGLWLG